MMRWVSRVKLSEIAISAGTEDAENWWNKGFDGIAVDDKTDADWKCEVQESGDE